MKLIIKLLRVLLKMVKIIWASPNTLLGLTIGCCGLLFGSKMLFSGGAIEFHGGLVKWLLSKVPVNPSAMTIGHTILGQTLENLDRSREHEMIHVRQYERWGIFFLPAYFLLSGIMWLRGKDSYRDNPFEVEAYSKTDPNYHRGHDHSNDVKNGNAEDSTTAGEDTSER